MHCVAVSPTGRPRSGRGRAASDLGPQLPVVPRLPGGASPAPPSARGRAASFGSLPFYGPQVPALPSAAGGASPALSAACAMPLGAGSPAPHAPWTSPRSTPMSSQQSPRVLVPALQPAPGTAGDLETAVKTAKANGKTALVIWFHFLGGKGSDWETSLKARLADHFPWVEWYFPDAPRRPITNYDGEVARGWFDMLYGQVTETMDTPGLEDSVAATHRMLRQAEALGLPAGRVVLGGMSQGGVLALRAGLTYDRPLAGIAAFSAWVPPGLPAAVRQPGTPLLIGSGDKDEVVPIALSRKGLALLRRAGCANISSKEYPGLDHTWAGCEREDAKSFLAAVLPGVPGGNGKLVATPTPTNLTWANVATPLRLH